MSSLGFFYLTEELQLFTLIPLAKYRLDCDIRERKKIIFAANSVHHVFCQTSPKFIRFHPIFLPNYSSKARFQPRGVGFLYKTTDNIRS